MASQLSQMAMMRAPTGMSRPARLSGWPQPSKRSWWWRIMGVMAAAARSGVQMRAPITECDRTMAYSTSVRGPGLSRMASAIPILPMSCRSPA